MGLGFSCLGFSAASWITSTVVSCFSAAACNLGCKSCNCNNSIATRIGYAIIFLTNSMLAWIMLSDWAIKHLEKITHLHLNCPEEKCYGVLAVHRICFALSLFHLILGLLVIKVNDTRDKRASIQNGWWGPKVLFWIFLLIISFFIPNEFFMFWGNSISLIGAAIFILVGLVILVDFVHSWSERCIEKWEEEGKVLWKYILVGSTLFLFITSIVFTGIMYKFFGGSGCHINQFFITFNLILCVIGVIISVHPVIQEANSRSGLSQSSMVVFYCTYLILSAVVNEPVSNNDDGGGDGLDDKVSVCNPLLNTAKGARTTTVVIGAFITFIAIAYSTSRAATQGKALITKSDYHPINTATAVPLMTNQTNNFSSNTRSDSLLAAVESGSMPASALDDDDDDDDDDYGGVDDERNGVAYNYTFFHFIFAIAAMYVAMLLTNWNTIQITEITGSDQLVIIGRSLASVWVKVVCSWICLLLYFWTLVAPVLLPERFEGLYF